MAKYLDYNGLVTLWSKIKNADTTTLNAAKSDTTSKINALNISGITSRIATNEGDIDTLQSDMTTAKSNITTLQSKVSTNTTDITTLKNQIGGLSGAMHFVGKFDSLPAVDSYSAGDVCIVGSKEYVLVVNGNTKTWNEFGNEGDHITRSEVETNYLKKTDASSTYLTKTNASSTYLTKSTASSTYETKTNVTALTTRVSTVEEYFSGGIAKKAIADKNNNDITTYYAKASDLTSTNSNVSTNANNIKTLQGHFDANGNAKVAVVANKATADANGKNIADTYATKSALSTTNSNVSTNTTNITTLKGYFDANGYAKVAVSAEKDTAGNDIMTTYATKKYVGDNFIKKTYEYKSGTVVNKIFTFKSTALVTSLTYKDDSENTLSGIYISNTGVQFLAPSIFQVYYEDKGTAYDILTTYNMVAITETEINTICQ